MEIDSVIQDQVPLTDLYNDPVVLMEMLAQDDPYLDESLKAGLETIDKTSCPMQTGGNFTTHKCIHMSGGGGGGDDSPTSLLPVFILVCITTLQGYNGYKGTLQEYFFNNLDQAKRESIERATPEIKKKLPLFYRMAESVGVKTPDKIAKTVNPNGPAELPPVTTTDIETFLSKWSEMPYIRAVFANLLYICNKLDLPIEYAGIFLINIILKSVLGLFKLVQLKDKAHDYKHNLPYAIMYVVTGILKVIIVDLGTYVATKQISKMFGPFNFISIAPVVYGVYKFVYTPDLSELTTVVGLSVVPFIACNTIHIIYSLVRTVSSFFGKNANPKKPEAGKNSWMIAKYFIYGGIIADIATGFVDQAINLLMPKYMYISDVIYKDIHKQLVILNGMPYNDITSPTHIHYYHTYTIKKWLIIYNNIKKLDANTSSFVIIESVNIAFKTFYDNSLQIVNGLIFVNPGYKDSETPNMDIINKSLYLYRYGLYIKNIYKKNDKSLKIIDAFITSVESLILNISIYLYSLCGTNIQLQHYLITPLQWDEAQTKYIKIKAESNPKP